MSISCDLFPLLTADGPRHMAVDEVLLEHAIAIGRPALRFYTWDPPTLSLGYFQAFADRLADLRVVRRQTGGGAIVHHHELTYALALPSGAIPVQSGGHGTRWICSMHDVIRATLGSLGVTGTVDCGQETGRGAFLCFEHHTSGDVLLGENKIVGSAQRRRAGALLQHGSILLAASPFNPRRRGIRELAKVVIDPQQLADDLARMVSHVTGWELRRTDWSDEQIVRQKQITAEKYGHSAWTERR